MIPYQNVFQYLLRHPHANFSQIAKAIGVSDKTAKSYYLFLVEHGVIKGSQAMYIPESLGLTTFTYLIDINDYPSLRLMEELADRHNFTVYRNRLYGKNNGLIMQFNVPPEAEIYLDALFMKIKDCGIIADFVRASTTQLKVRTYPNLEYFDNVGNIWKWNYQDWANSLGTYNPGKEFVKENTRIENVLHRFTKLDAKLLRALTANAKRPNVELAKELNASKVQISRRKTFLESNVISEYRLIYDRSKIQFVDYILFKVKCDADFKMKLYHYIKQHPVPFDSGMDITNDGFLWRLNLPPSYVSYFAELLMKNSEELEYYALDPLNSALYWFYDENFDEENKSWKASKKELYEEPLHWLEENARVSYL